MTKLFLTYFALDGTFLNTAEIKSKNNSKTAIIKEIKDLRDKNKLPSTRKKNVHILIKYNDLIHLLQYKKRITTASAKGKGRRLQNWTAKKISELLEMPWGKDEIISPREMGQSGTDVRLVADAKELFPWSIECKNCESWNIPSFIKQAKDNQLPSTDWLVIMTKNNFDNIVVLDAEVFFDILRLMKGSKKGR